MAATMETIRKATMRAETEGADYDVTFLTENLWMVTRKGDDTRKYSVRTLEGFESCQCKAFAKGGFCKHYALCLDAEYCDIRAAELADYDAYAKY